jgi:hypothetical protein
VERERPDLRHDLSGLRRESIRQALGHAGEDTALAEPAFDLFFAHRQKVDLYDDALPALEFLSARWPVIALSNGNANVHTIGLGRYFQASLNVAAPALPSRTCACSMRRRRRRAWRPSRCCTSATTPTWTLWAPWVRVCTRSGSIARA